ncbi:hypothetical protein BUALT_Bualt03G0030400 [Buddleja alternifolia]|uniref:MADS-box domain-containing protein n=1 Tax=Buddleja alternifolia TaxID=168488 RepID=A0AAV6XQQ8_9LAMI|nr:hypothetical protein BUALT_Bualt03G0030400 [Buddleja alternifolia]
MGLFRKASELSILCGAEIAILVQSPAGKMFAFGHPSVEYLIDRFQTGLYFSPEMGAGSSSQYAQIFYGENNRSKYAEAVRRLEIEKRMEEEKESAGKEREFWWDEPFEGMELHELEEYVEALEELGNNVVHRVEEIEKFKLMAASSNLLPLPSHDHDQGFEYNNIGGFPIHDHQDFHGGKTSIEEAKVEANHAVKTQEDSAASGSSSNFVMNPTDDHDINDEGMYRSVDRVLSESVSNCGKVRPDWG